MRGYCILLLLLVTLLLPDTDGWWRRRRRRRWIRRRWIKKTWRRHRWWITPAAAAVLGKRGEGAEAVDANKDGTIDHAEAMTLMGEERAARDLLSQADIDGDSHVTVDEFKRSMRDLMRMDSDELLEAETDFKE